MYDYQQLISKWEECTNYLPIHTHAEAEEFLFRLSPIEEQFIRDPGSPELWDGEPDEPSRFGGRLYKVMRQFRFDPHLMHHHDFFEIQYMYSGNGYLDVEGMTVTLKPGDVCILSGGISHRVRLASMRAALIKVFVRRSDFYASYKNWMSVDNILTGFFGQYLTDEQHKNFVIFKTARDERIRHIFLDLLIEFQCNGEYCAMMSESLMTMLFCQLTRAHLDSMYTYDSIVPDTGIGEILAYIRDNCTTVTLDELSRRTNYTKNYLCRIIRHYTGKTLTELCGQQKSVLACGFLQRQDMSIPEIAEASGFNNIEHFYRVFKRHIGMTPAAYRRTCFETSTN